MCSQSAAVGRKSLAGYLLAAISRGMCNIVYTEQAHRDYAFSGCIKGDQYVGERQRQALKGALCGHFCIASYERITAVLLDWDIVANCAPDVFEMRVNADDIPAAVLERNDCRDEMFSGVVEAFLNFDCQPGWPGNHFSSELVSEFRDAGLIEGQNGNLNWTADMSRHFRHVLAVPWDADDFFDRICT